MASPVRGLPDPSGFLEKRGLADHEASDNLIASGNPRLKWLIPLDSCEKCFVVGGAVLELETFPGEPGRNGG